MSTLTPGHETNIGLTYRLLQDVGNDTGLRVFYEPGIQWRGFRRSHEVLAGIGINRQIQRAYRWLAEGYKPGDRVILKGFSRGAYAVRSLAGLIDRMGLLRLDALDDARMETLYALYALYRTAPESEGARAMTQGHCHIDVPITFIGAYDTVRALGIRYPLMWRLLPLPHPYHSHTLGQHVQVARHALALDETRTAYRPVLWKTPNVRDGQDVEQQWFRGSHGDIGGHLSGRLSARPRGNVSLVWMLSEAEANGLHLPDAWRDRFPTNADAPSVGTLAGFSKLLWARKRRSVGRDPSESLHESARDYAKARGFIAEDVQERSTA
jgi:uncharacterized protein (DUF2235 family)